MSDEIRLSKILSETGIASRREADEMITKGWVLIDGKVAELGARVSSHSKWELTPAAQEWLSRKVTIMINKPPGYLSSPSSDPYPLVLKLITKENYFSKNPLKQLPFIKDLAPLGRLDIDSRGLLLLSQNGVLAKKIIGEDSLVDKEYKVQFEGELTNEKIKLLRHGLELDEQKLKPAIIERLDDRTLRFTLQEGKKRQIRRMCELVDLDVTSIMRTRVGKLQLGELPLGKWQFVMPWDIL